MNLTRREVKGRYSQSLFGIAWAIAQPLATMAVFTLVFARLANMSDGGVPYPVFVYAGLVPWFFFLNSVNSGTMSLIQVPQHRHQDLLSTRDHSAGAGLFAAAGFRRGRHAGCGADRLLPRGVTPLGAARPGAVRPAGRVYDCGHAAHFGGERVLSRRQPGRTDRPAAVAVCDADRLSASRECRSQWKRWIALNPLSGIIEGFRSAVVYGRAPDWRCSWTVRDAHRRHAGRRLCRCSNGSTSTSPMSSSPTVIRLERVSKQLSRRTIADDRRPDRFVHRSPCAAVSRTSTARPGAGLALRSLRCET